MFSNRHMSVGDWWVFFLLMAIPLVNILMFLILLLSSGTNRSLKNFQLALILPGLIVLALFLIGGFTLFPRW
jgi:hypothetical protein